MTALIIGIACGLITWITALMVGRMATRGRFGPNPDRTVTTPGAITGMTWSWQTLAAFPFVVGCGVAAVYLGLFAEPRLGTTPAAFLVGVCVTSASTIIETFRAHRRPTVTDWEALFNRRFVDTALKFAVGMLIAAAVWCATTGRATFGPAVGDLALGAVAVLIAAALRPSHH